MQTRRRQRKDMLPRKIFQEVLYRVGPPILEQCSSCHHAIIECFDPKELCALRLEVKTVRVECALAHDCWKEGECQSFKNGNPSTHLKIPIVSN